MTSSSHSPLVLILTQPADEAMNWVEAEFERKGVACLRYDLGAFPLASSLSAQLASGKTWQTSLGVNGQSLLLEGVTAVWNGHVTNFNLGDTIHPDTLRYVRGECAEGFGGLLRSMCPAIWMNHPDAVLRASYKPYQLQVASLAGLKVPATILSNRSDDLVDFYVRHGGSVVCKSFHMISRPREDAVLHAPHTTLVRADDVANLEECAKSLTFFQEFVDQKYALRVIYLPKELLAVEIHSPAGRLGSVEGITDWRSIYSELSYKVHELPEPLSVCLRSFMTRMGLSYGAIDMLVKPDGSYVFLEVNARGAWGWLEEETQVPITRSIANALIGTE